MGIPSQVVYDKYAYSRHLERFTDQKHHSRHQTTARPQPFDNIATIFDLCNAQRFVNFGLSSTWKDTTEIRTNTIQAGHRRRVELLIPALETGGLVGWSMKYDTI